MNDEKNERQRLRQIRRLGTAFRDTSDCLYISDVIPTNNSYGALKI